MSYKILSASVFAVSLAVVGCSSSSSSSTSSGSSSGGSETDVCAALCDAKCSADAATCKANCAGIYKQVSSACTEKVSAAFECGRTKGTVDCTLKNPPPECKAESDAINACSQANPPPSDSDAGGD